jgi:hypothetical protein
MVKKLFPDVGSRLTPCYLQMLVPDVLLAKRFHGIFKNAGKNIT